MFDTLYRLLSEYNNKHNPYNKDVYFDDTGHILDEKSSLKDNSLEFLTSHMAFTTDDLKIIEKWFIMPSTIISIKIIRDALLICIFE